MKIISMHLSEVHHQIIFGF